MALLYERLVRFGYPIERLGESRHRALMDISRDLGPVDEIPESIALDMLNFHALNESQIRDLRRRINEAKTEVVDRFFSEAFWWYAKPEYWGSTQQRVRRGSVITKQDLITSSKLRDNANGVWESLGAPSAKGGTLTEQAASILDGISGDVGSILRKCYGKPIITSIEHPEREDLRRVFAAIPVKDNLLQNLGVFISLTLAAAQIQGQVSEKFIVAVDPGEQPRDTDVVVRSLDTRSPVTSKIGNAGVFILLSARSDHRR